MWGSEVGSHSKRGTGFFVPERRNRPEDPIQDVVPKSTRKIPKGGENLEVKVKQQFRHEGKEFEEGEKISPIGPNGEAEETEEEGETIWNEMEESLDGDPELPSRWNLSREDVKNGEVSPPDVEDLLSSSQPSQPRNDPRLGFFRGTSTPCKPFAYPRTLERERFERVKRNMEKTCLIFYSYP
ncbi:hypothetical protein AKJ65_04345 [candidate division MSBL1 archaeon SCGC-AAA259E19]|uniref:Uncharacterized protein n=1 Tax=candidate division MSBL1 archaeon SCGC-AAA259E19 TaxID=1698264 RepID=A0A133UK11_9EURY|nr:hypothetical protein AKJ65_04345 [candidate division MSBL1 archaeon SCGC-AAA259E19]